MLQTSGLMLTEEKDGSIVVQYVDYDTPFGGDFESIYTLDKANAEKLKVLLKKKYPENELVEALKKEVGKNLNDFKFRELMKLNEIEYTHVTWTS